MLSRQFSKAAVRGARGFSTYPAFVVKAPITEVTKAANGARIATEASIGETATVGVFVDAGSRNEKASGAAQLVQQLMVKAAKGKIEAMGAQLSSYTTREKTVYSVKALKGDVSKAVEILGSALTGGLPDAATLAAEKAALVSAGLSASYEDVILDELHTTAFMGTNLGSSILDADNVANLSKADLAAFISANYTADRVVIAGAGAVEHKQLCDVVQKAFGALAAPTGTLALHYEPASFTGSDKRIRYDSMGEAHIALAFKGASSTSEQAFPLMIAQTILGSYCKASSAAGKSSSHFAGVVAEFDIATSFKSFNTCYKDTGLFGVYLVAPDNKLDDLMWYTCDNMVRLCHNVTDDEVAMAKTQLKASLMAKLGTSSSIVDDIGSQMLSYGRKMSTAETFARIDAIGASDVKAACNAVINDEDHALAALGPIFELPDYNWIRRRSYWHRY